MIDIWPEQIEPKCLAPEIATPPVESPWRSIASDPPPKDSLIDVWWKWWRADTDTFIGKRVADCVWFTVTGKHGWRSDSGIIPSNARPTHWMKPPDGPVS